MIYIRYKSPAYRKMINNFINSRTLYNDYFAQIILCGTKLIFQVNLVR